MADYIPLDITPYCNAGHTIFGKDLDPPVGEQTFYGLPFRIGSGAAEEKCYLGFGSNDGLMSKPVTLPLNESVHTITIAHTLLETEIFHGGPVGQTIADYVFRYGSGEEVSIPIRERFEISALPLQWGQYPFLSVPDQKSSLIDRYYGPWEQAGRRETEADQGWPQAYFLWSWRNPKPDCTIQEIEIRPGGQSFIIAAITIGSLDEEPLFRTAARSVKIDLKNPEDANQKFNLQVEVDRGVATYPYPLPEQSPDEFLNDPYKGWGEKQNETNNPSYVEIAGTPSATVTIKQEGEEVGKANWGEIEEKQVVETDRLRIEVVDGGRNWVHTTVVDEDTGDPIPCRVHFRSEKGIPYAPHGHHAHVNSNMGTWHMDIGGDVRLGQISYAYIDGKCQGWLPRGDLIVDVARGFEYEPLRTRVHIAPGQRELQLKLKRWTDLTKERYFSGDTHVHFLSTQGAHTEAQGEGLHVVNLLLSQWGSLFTNTEEFTGNASISGDGDSIVYATQENRQHMLGHLTLLGLKEPVMPWCSGGPGEAELGGNLETTLSHWADACHAQGGTVVIPHIPTPNCEPATLIATGRADAVEMLVHNEYNHLEYYKYLNCGYKLPLAGGTDKMSSDVPVGIYRTYAYVPDVEEFTYDAWCKALRSGNTFHSAGPILKFSVNGEPLGNTVQLTGNGGTVEFIASAESILPIHSLEIVQQGQVVASTEDPNGTRKLELRGSLTIEGNSWLAARCAGPNYTSLPHYDGWRRGIMAHTSPIYIACGGEYHLFNLENAQYMLSLVDGGLSYIRQRSPQLKPGTVTHHHGEDDHQKFLERPFLEARAAIHKRMHDLGIPH